MKILSTLKTIRQELNNFFNDILANTPIDLNAQEKKILSEIKRKGFYVIPDFYSSLECEALTKKIDELIEKYKNQIFKDAEDSDHRIFGADKLSPLIGKFYNNSFINNIIEAHEKTKKIVGFTMAAKLEYSPNNLGSGGGWHRDWAVNKQIKAIAYLTDVSLDSGPFQYLEGSHQHLNIIKEGFVNNFKFNQNRFSDAEIEKMIKKNPNGLQTFTAKAGTIILVNTRGIHRGMPIKEGTRYALTNYYWSNMPIPEHLAKMVIKE